MTVVFYISGHGFGHASRDVEVINTLGARGNCRIVVRSAVSPSLLARTIRVPYEVLAGPTDTGIVQTTSITHDDEATVRETLAFYDNFDERVARDVERLSSFDVTAIVGDVPPLAFAVAARLGVPSVALANFTWDWIYEGHPGFLPAGAAALETMRRAYRTATLALELPFPGGFDIFPRVEPIPMIARRATRTREETRAHFGLPADARLALLSFGGYGLPALDLGAVDCAGSWTIVTTDRVTPDAAWGPHVRRIAEDAFDDGAFRYEDLVGAVDAVVTKPGYGIIAECASTGTPMLYTSRGVFREYDRLVAGLPHVVRSRFIAQDDLLAGRWSASLDALLAEPAPAAPPAVNGADVAAARILEVAR